MKKVGLSMFMMWVSAGLLLPLAAVAGESDPASVPKEPMGNLVMILSTDDLPSADAAIRMAEVAAKRGHKVTLLLRVKAIHLALKDTDYRIGATTFQDKLASFMKAGPRVFVGGSCMRLEGIAKERLIPGVMMGTPDAVMGMIFEENTRIICQ